MLALALALARRGRRRGCGRHRLGGHGRGRGGCCGRQLLDQRCARLHARRGGGAVCGWLCAARTLHRPVGADRERHQRSGDRYRAHQTPSAAHRRDHVVVSRDPRRGTRGRERTRRTRHIGERVVERVRCWRLYRLRAPLHRRVRGRSIRRGGSTRLLRVGVSSGARARLPHVRALMGRHTRLRDGRRWCRACFRPPRVAQRLRHARYNGRVGLFLELVEEELVFDRRGRPRLGRWRWDRQLLRRCARESRAGHRRRT